MTPTLPTRPAAAVGAPTPGRLHDPYAHEGAPVVARTRLVRRLRAHLAAGEAVVVQAPFGCGTSLLLEQLARVARGVLVRIDATGFRTFDDRGEPRHHPLEHLLAAAVEAAAEGKPLLVDDADRLEPSVVDRLRRTAISGLVVGCREVPAGDEPFSLLIQQRILRFDAAEARALLALHGRPASEADVERLLRTTGGWPAGTTWAVAPELADEPIEDRLLRECLRALSPATLDAVRVASVLGPCSPAFLEAVTGDDRIVDTLIDAQHRVPLLDITLTPSPRVTVGEQVAQVVVAEFELTGAAALADLRRRGAAAAAAHGDHATAHRLLAAQRDPIDLVRHLYVHGFDLLLNRRPDVDLDRWMARFRHDDLVRWPRLATLQAGLALLHRSVGEAHHWLEVAGRPDPLAAELGVTPAAQVASLIRDEYLRDHAYGGPSRVPVGNELSAGEVMRALLHCGRLVRRGELDRARTALQGLAPHTARFSVFETARQVHLAMLCCFRLDDSGAAHHLDLAAELADERDDACTEHLFDAVSAVVRARAGRLETARGHLTRGLRRLADAPDRTGPGGLMSSILLLEAAMTLDEEEQAKQAAASALAALDVEPEAVVLHRRFEQLLARYGRRFDGDRRSPLARLTRTELSILRLLDSPMPVPAIAAELSVGAATVRSHVKSIYVKLHVGSRLEAVDVYRRVMGLSTGTIDAIETSDDAASA